MKLGKYRHYKNKDYEVIAVWKHSDNLEDFVVYQALYDSEEFGNNAVWVKPMKNFTENVIIDWETVPRFRYIWE